MSANTGYANGSDLLIMIGSKAVGHCTSHTVSYSSETKDRAVKPSLSTTAMGGAGKWKEKTVTGLSVQIKADGLRYYGETEEGMNELLAAWKAGSAVTVKAFVRNSDSAPYLSGSFVISSMEESAPAGDDVTYNVTLDNSGAVTITEANVDGASSGDGGDSGGSGGSGGSQEP